MASAAADSHRKPDPAGVLPNLASPILKPWGDRPMLRCANDDGHGEFAAFDCNHSLDARSTFSSGRRGRRSAVSLRPRLSPEVEETEEGDDGDDDGGLEELRSKLMNHLREAADRMKVTAAAMGTATLSEVAETSTAAAATARPWNLRTRRAACKRPLRDRSHPGPPPSQLMAPTFSTTTTTKAAAPIRGQRTVRLRSETAREAKTRRPRFSVALTAEEIEEDIFAVTGSRARRRPMKRPRAVQRQLDALFPGLFLTEITLDMYKVSDN